MVVSEPIRSASGALGCVSASVPWMALRESRTLAMLNNVMNVAERDRIPVRDTNPAKNPAKGIKRCRAKASQLLFTCSEHAWPCVESLLWIVARWFDVVRSPSRMPQFGTSGLMSGDGSDGHSAPSNRAYPRLYVVGHDGYGCFRHRLLHARSHGLHRGFQNKFRMLCHRLKKIK